MKSNGSQRFVVLWKMLKSALAEYEEEECVDAEEANLRSLHRNGYTCVYAHTYKDIYISTKVSLK